MHSISPRGDGQNPPGGGGVIRRPDVVRQREPQESLCAQPRAGRSFPAASRSRTADHVSFRLSKNALYGVGDPRTEVQFRAASTLTETRSDFSNYFWPPCGCIAGPIV